MLETFFPGKCVFPDWQIMDTHDLYEDMLFFLTQWSLVLQ